MPRPIKIGKRWFTNLDMPCTGEDCRTPQKPKPHTHRRRLGHDTREGCDKTIGEMTQVRRQIKHGFAKGEISWRLFKEKYRSHMATKAPDTQKWDRLAIRYLEEFYMPGQLKEVTPEYLTGLKQYLQNRHKGPFTVNRVIMAVKAMMHVAEDWKYIDPQRWRIVKRIKTVKGRLHYWENVEIKALYMRCTGIWETIARLAIEAGLRKTEILNLQFKNVDFEKSRIHIVGDETWHPKDYERRAIPMKESLKAHLQTIQNGSEYILGDERPAKTTISQHFSRLVRAAGIPGSLHVGRHSYASHLAMKGVPIPVIQQRMGHADIKTTMIYAHLCPDKMQAVYDA